MLFDYDWLLTMLFILTFFSIYEKLIEFCGIDEKGTNYPPELYDPSIWGKESFYDALGMFVSLK